VKSSSFTGSATWIDFQGFDQGQIGFDTIRTKGNEVLKGRLRRAPPHGDDTDGGREAALTLALAHT
jgi:hypothetical protein